MRPKYKVSRAPISFSPGKPDTAPPSPCTTRIATPEEIDAMLSKYNLTQREKKPVIPGKRR